MTERARIDSLEAGQMHLADAARAPGSVLVVTVRTAVPDWLADLASAAGAAGASVVIEAEPPSDLAGERLAGWEVGVCAASLSAGAAEVTGISTRRVARVREVDALLTAAAAHTTAETTS